MKSFFLRYAALRKKRMQGGLRARQLLVSACCFFALVFMLAAPEDAVAFPSQLAEEESVAPPVMHQASPTGLELQDEVKSTDFLAPAADAEPVRLTNRTKRPHGLAVQGAIALISALMVVFAVFCFARRFSSEKEMGGAHTRRLAAGEGVQPPEECSSLDESEDFKVGQGEEGPESQDESESEYTSAGSIGSQSDYSTQASDDDEDDEDEDGFREWDVENLSLVGTDTEDEEEDDDIPSSPSPVEFWDAEEDGEDSAISEGER
ncbi:hypothetical protein Emag_007223 [Eimeria magna]